ncbi:sigma 54-interacting transcriptional regulator [Flavobacterium sp.]|uniref:sigma 54-interacting transcriptional regulator n=1 Tax=Flavobacterium sp. TaxID=239 RepID=UPI0039E6E187
MDRKILIVEDEYVLANALRLILVQAKYKVIGIASSVAEADGILQNEKPDLVLLDIQLEGKKTGVDLAQKLKATGIAFIYLSANSSQKVLEEVKKTEPYGFLVKPYREKDLLVALDIAFYRLQNSIESKAQREASLQQKITQINREPAVPEQKLLQLARELQPHIPFDLIICQYPTGNGQSQTFGYLRVGFDEYQFIGEKEAMTITGQDKNVLCENDPPLSQAFIADLSKPSTDFQKALALYFNMDCYLSFATATEGGDLRYLFCSRKPDSYQHEHLALLERLKDNLAEVAAPVSHLKATSPQPGVLAPVELKTIIGKHPLLLAALDLTMQVAPYQTSVLILGESGTGKEKIAECLHTFSPRKNQPFVKINCAAIPVSLIEAELFGHEKGAFTGAVEKRKGKFEQADGGTIFLDEIGELSLDMQVRLLRVLQEKEIDPVGGGMPRKVDVRIVAATNRNLEKEIAAGNFRLDLYYRLNVFPITLPPLRERKSDVGLLGLYFAQKFCTEFNKDFPGIGAKMTEAMNTYHWPGNIRELENVIQRSVILSDGKSGLEWQQNFSDAATGLPEKPALETFEDVRNAQRETERDYLIAVLKKTNGRIRGMHGAAELLDIKPTTLESKMAKLGVRKEDYLP